MNRLVIVLLLTCAACNGEMDDPEGDLAAGGDMGGGGGDMGGGGDESQGPAALNGAAIQAWLGKGLYRQWRCEDRVMTMRQGAHGVNRVCQNAAQVGGTAPFPTGAASVKELYNSTGDTLMGHTFAIRTGDGDGGATRYWYEKLGDRVFADGQGAGLCTGCHKMATDDYTYIVLAQ